MTSTGLEIAMSAFNSFGRFFFRFVPHSNDLLLRLSQRYLDRHYGQNDSNPVTNGEDAFLRTVLPGLRGGVIFDVGANVGNWSSFALSLNPSLTIHIFEPSSQTYYMCSEKRWPETVSLNNIGLGEHREKLLLKIVEPGSGMNSLYSRQGVEAAESASTEEVQIETLDNYCVEHGINHIDFLKADVEGHELAVFKGARRMLERRGIEMIQFEYGALFISATKSESVAW